MLGFGQKSFVALDDRGFLAVTGPDARAFLQGVITNDVNKARPGQAIFAAVLSPQGRYLFDFFIVDLDGVLFLDVAKRRLDDLRALLLKYRLRAKVEIDDVSKLFRVIALLGDGPHDSQALHGFEGRGGPFAAGFCYVDPRYAGIGARAMLPAAGVEALGNADFTASDRMEYENLRLHFGIPEGTVDLVAEKSLPMEANFDLLNGIDWTKGCYVGQELTARMHYRALIKKRLLPVEIDGEVPDIGTAVTYDGQDAGEMRSGMGDQGIALLRLELVLAAVKAEQPLLAGDSKISPKHPPWLPTGEGEANGDGATAETADATKAPN